MLYFKAIKSIVLQGIYETSTCSLGGAQNEEKSFFFGLEKNHEYCVDSGGNAVDINACRVQQQYDAYSVEQFSQFVNRVKYPEEKGY